MPLVHSLHDGDDCSDCGGGDNVDDDGDDTEYPLASQ
jgi:hypothetical protein